MKQGIGLYGELIPGQVRRIERRRRVDIGHGFFKALVRQTVHQIQVKALVSGCSNAFGGVDGFILAVNSPQQVELVFGKALHTDGEASDTCGAVSAEVIMFQGAWVGLHGDLYVIGKGNAPVHALQQPAYLGSIEQGGVPPPIKMLCSCRP